MYPLRARLAAEPELIIDVGANHGLFTMLLAHLYPEAEVIALEPNPLVVHMLRATVGARRAAARRSRVRVLHAALANASATSASFRMARTAIARISPYRFAGKFSTSTYL